MLVDNEEEMETTNAEKLKQEQSVIEVEFSNNDFLVTYFLDSP